jgi:hypothetical protein
MSDENRAQAKAQVKQVKAIFKDAQQASPGSIQTTPDGYVVSPAELFEIVLGLMNIKQFQHLTIFNARGKLVENREVIIAYFQQMLEEKKAEP